MAVERVELDADTRCDDFGLHCWMPAGGGMLICARCEETRWADDEGSGDGDE